GEARFDQITQHDQHWFVRRPAHRGDERRDAGFHARTPARRSSGFREDGFAQAAVAGSVREQRAAIRARAVPVIRLSAPTATWAVAMSAALLVQIVAAPRVAWRRTSPS